MRWTPTAATAAAMFLFSFGLVLFELVLTRLFSVVLFASFAHLAIALALLGISVGALAQHLWPSLVPDEGLEERLGWLSLAMAASTVVATLYSTLVPVTIQWQDTVADYGERSTLGWDLVHLGWFASLLPVLSVPFAIAGLAFAGAFQRRKQHIGLLYGFDLLGGAASAVAFVPLLYAVPGPDNAFVVAFAGAAGAAGLFFAAGRRSLAAASAVPAAVALALAVVAASGDGVLKVRYAAGFSEKNVIHTEWTPLTRLSVHRDGRGDYVLLDNASASEVVTTRARVQELVVRDPNRSLVYELHEPPARIAILAASAGPEVAVAQSFGFTGIEAVDIAAEIGDLVAERYADAEVNPFLQGGTNRVLLDGRAAILHSPHDYDIVQMVHANLHSEAGQLANAWSPALLETREAFALYLSRLSPDGTLSFGRGPKTRWLVRACVAAMEELGIEHPERNVIWIAGPASVMLAKKRPWTVEEREEIERLIARRPGQYVHYDPLAPDPERWAEAMKAPLLTDDRPYLESRAQAVVALGDAFRHVVGLGDDEVEAVAIVYHTMALQVLYVVAVGLLCVLVPAFRRERTGLVGLGGVGGGLGYVACLGYGYLAVETVLLHELVLFVGHPTYAITVVILSMLLFSGIGSNAVERFPQERLPGILTGVLAGVVVLGLLQAFVVPGMLYAWAFGLPIGWRTLLVFAVLAPLGLLMGMPFPLALRILRPEAAGLVPWAWALNGWMSVVASLGTVLVSRLVGYRAAFVVAIAAYVLAMVLAPALRRIGGDVRRNVR